MIKIKKRNGEEFYEKVYGDKYMHLLHNNEVIKKSILKFLVKPWVSKIYGLYIDSPLSRYKIDQFIKKYEVDMSEFETAKDVEGGHDYQSFNQFFIREFKLGKRKFCNDGISAFAEGRYFAFSSESSKEKFPIKNVEISIDDLIGHRKFDFDFGEVVIARLCPVDYHRYHFPVDGTCSKSYKIGNKLYSVNPIAMKKFPKTFLKNERVITELETEYGKMLYIEVGALLVGKIVNRELNDFKRGDEKGHFLFGGSTVILIGEKGKWEVDNDIRQHTKDGIETYIKLGEKISKN